MATKSSKDYYNSWSNPCKSAWHKYQKQDLIGAPDLTQPSELMNRNNNVLSIQKKAEELITQSITTLFPDAKDATKNFENGTKFYRLQILPLVPEPTKEYIKKEFKNKVVKALKEVSVYLRLYSSALHQISLDNIIYPNVTSDKVFWLESAHNVVICELEMTLGAFGESPSDNTTVKAKEFALTNNPADVMRHMRQYLVVRDYISLLSFVSFVYRYFGKDTALT